MRKGDVKVIGQHTLADHALEGPVHFCHRPPCTPDGAGYVLDDTTVIGDGLDHPLLRVLLQNILHLWVHVNDTHLHGSLTCCFLIGSLL